MHNLPDWTKTNFINEIVRQFEIFFNGKQDLTNNNNF